MRRVAVVNQKGGCGKTTTAINLAAFLASQGRRTLVVDMDPQGHSTIGLLHGAVQPQTSIYDVFVPPSGRAPISIRDITQTVAERLDLAPADVQLSAVPEALAGLPRRTDILADQMQLLGDAYDYVVFDCPPGVGLLTFNALKAAAEAIVPVDPSFFSLHGIAKLLETFDVLAKNTGHTIAWQALITMYGGRTAFEREVVANLRAHLAGRCFDTVIRHSVKLAEAASHGVPIVSYQRRCAGFEDYSALAAEVMQAESLWPTASRPARPAAAPEPTPDGMLFTIDAPGARRVQLVGDFNDWTTEGSDMRASGPVWSRVVPLTSGRYRYRFIVDGEWRSDPLNAATEPAPFGGTNSVVVVGEPAFE